MELISCPSFGYNQGHRFNPLVVLSVEVPEFSFKTHSTKPSFPSPAVYLLSVRQQIACSRPAKCHNSGTF